ncbi:cullin-associated NEDD8-dissociated protein 1-like isoform X1 [Lates japonicus]|uniref:Cullin-associated NEDD8-dissociated protein 1-like isoform X1 n=1 Tax=Lates japonicus TaxID=270547 RepID=A0AAD3R7K4_LATJO|nr:cullin-associated NEDD8-dissociated protein 1-like isoform X1 [Lates japonicus]
MTFDPNYNYDDDEEEEEDSMDIEDGLDEESDDEYSDDDDMSWKVRSSSIKCLEALIGTRRDLLLSFYSSVCPALLARFKEREENVRADVFATFSTLLRQTRVGSSHHGLGVAPGSDPGSGRGEEEEPAVAMLKKQVPLIVKALHRQLKEKSIKSRQGCFCLLTELSHTLPGALEPHIPALTYLITSEALLVTQQLVRVMRPQGQTATTGGFDPKPFVKQVFTVTLKRLKATDIDQEVKERAISCMGRMIDLSRSILPETLSVLGSFLEEEPAALKLARLPVSPLLLATHHYYYQTRSSGARMNVTPVLVDEADMHISSSASRESSGLGPHSPLLQGGALAAILDFIQALVLSKTSNLATGEESRPPESARVLALQSREVGRSAVWGGSEDGRPALLGSMAVGSLNDFLPFPAGRKSPPSHGDNTLLSTHSKKSSVPVQPLVSRPTPSRSGSAVSGTASSYKLLLIRASWESRLPHLYKEFRLWGNLIRVKAGSVKQEFEKQESYKAMLAVSCPAGCARDDAGVYWCGVKSNDKYHRAARKKIQLEVQDIPTFTRSQSVGQNISYWCKYPQNPPTDKFICKGEDPSICQRLVNMDNGKFSMKDDTGKRNITITCYHQHQNHLLSTDKSCGFDPVIIVTAQCPKKAALC